MRVVYVRVRPRAAVYTLWCAVCPISTANATVTHTVAGSFTAVSTVYNVSGVDYVATLGTGTFDCITGYMSPTGPQATVQCNTTGEWTVTAACTLGICASLRAHTQAHVCRMCGNELYSWHKSRLEQSSVQLYAGYI